MKKIYSFIAVLMITIMMIPTTVKASTVSMPTISKEIIYQDEQYTIEVTTIIEMGNQTVYAATGTKTVSKLFEIKNYLGSVVATYTLKGTFRYDGTTATCISASYSTSTDSVLWSFESATASASGAKAIGSFTAKTLIPPQTVSQDVKITCSKTGVIS